ncbi:methionyl-tRNA formyltransferase [Candidatus Kaiserbacteria bacterium CG10_big_fil_rev_8_21_14_0_10_49_17]|uniref:methionyl-tRNA formyltransferase n=1 Tax=Candidatus Kaiserbacteria bacterium CG10_big_fil_rev_8_21_14_0_10_49_17 TaxID=1974609 RepID=A0A2M6WE40_9BACT|nr:MAG: methionyl-tRNA formyltransferase [Candidatus Kaiserbacteria bacterium CG10_big_fil_rev_8_21_14_0_10_49_17]
MKNNSIQFVFFGTPELSVTVLEELKKEGFMPRIVVTAPDTPHGRGMKLAPPPVKVWALKNSVAVLQPRKITEEVIAELAQEQWDVFIVAAYGKILPQTLLDIPMHGTLNVHPSLLPRLRGPSPIRSAILLDEKVTGVSIMLLDAEMDHGPILAQEVVEVVWPPRAPELEKRLAKKGGEMLAKILPQWVAGEIAPQEQEHEKATFCRMLKKGDAEINLSDDPYQNLLKIRGYEKAPGAYFFTEKNGKKIRVKVVSAERDESGSLKLLRVIPEGKKETHWENFNKN